jgi:hypothetical protein
VSLTDDMEEKMNDKEQRQLSALRAGTHEPAVDDFGNQYLLRRNGKLEPAPVGTQPHSSDGRSVDYYTAPGAVCQFCNAFLSTGHKSYCPVRSESIEVEAGDHERFDKNLKVKNAETVAVSVDGKTARLKMNYDGGVCHDCGGMLVRTGTCRTCMECGSSDGCG